MSATTFSRQASNNEQQQQPQQQPQPQPQASGTSMTWQLRLQGQCQQQGQPAPRYEMFSDRRGGRTAWSSTVEVAGKRYQARYWYDGTYANNAKEDAAEVALQHMGMAATPRSPYRQTTARAGRGTNIASQSEYYEFTR